MMYLRYITLINLQKLKRCVFEIDREIKRNEMPRQRYDLNRRHFVQVTLKEIEDHKASTHPRVLCSHFELVGDQLEQYKHLYLPGRDAPTDAARDASLTEMVCSKCAKGCPSLGELHRHMLECGGDQAWLLGLTGSGKKKCKWRPFGSRSRRRRQRGMKRNIQNSQTQPRVVNVERSKEKQAPTGPRVRPSDRKNEICFQHDIGLRRNTPVSQINFLSRILCVTGL